MQRNHMRYIIGLFVSISLVGCSLAVKKEIAYVGKLDEKEALSPNFAKIKTLRVVMSAEKKDYEAKFNILGQALAQEFSTVKSPKLVLTPAKGKPAADEATLLIKVTDYDIEGGGIKMRWGLYKDGKIEVDAKIETATSQASLGSFSALATPSIDKTSVGNSKMMFGGSSDGGENLALSRLVGYFTEYMKLKPAATAEKK